MKLNPNATVRVENVRGVPVLYIDDFYADPEAVRQQAIASAFDQSLALYPGRHAPIDTAELAVVKQHLCAVMTMLGDRVFSPETMHSDFSILTTKPRDLLASQKHPHIDPGPVLGIVYLNPGRSTGTCFFHNRKLGIHLVRTAEDQERLGEFLATEGPTYEPEGYDLTGNAVWEKIYTIEGRWNRFVMYPGNVFHSIDISDIPEDFDFATTRLTQRFLVNDSAAKATI